MNRRGSMRNKEKFRAEYRVDLWLEFLWVRSNLKTLMKGTECELQSEHQEWRFTHQKTKNRVIDLYKNRTEQVTQQKRWTASWIACSSDTILCLSWHSSEAHIHSGKGKLTKGKFSEGSTVWRKQNKSGFNHKRQKEWTRKEATGDHGYSLESRPDWWTRSKYQNGRKQCPRRMW